MLDYSEALKYVTEYLRTYPDAEKSRKHKEFVEEGFAGTRYRVRGPFEVYSMITYGRPEVDMPNYKLRDALIQIAAESVILLAEYIDAEQLSLKTILFDEWEDAKTILDILKIKIVKDKFASLYDYYYFTKATSQLSPVMKIIGWTKLDRVPIMKLGKRYYLDLPKPIKLER